jgi:hypothetical protein
VIWSEWEEYSGRIRAWQMLGFVFLGPRESAPRVGKDPMDPQRQPTARPPLEHGLANKSCCATSRIHISEKFDVSEASKACFFRRRSTLLAWTIQCKRVKEPSINRLSTEDGRDNAATEQVKKRKFRARIN